MEDSPGLNRDEFAEYIRGAGNPPHKKFEDYVDASPEEISELFNELLHEQQSVHDTQDEAF